MVEEQLNANREEERQMFMGTTGRWHGPGTLQTQLISHHLLESGPVRETVVPGGLLQ